MTPPQHKRGIHAYGKMLFGADWKFPKSYLYPMEEYRYMNGGVQLWSRDGRMKAREHFTSVGCAQNIVAMSNVLAVEAAKEALQDEAFYKFSLAKNKEAKTRIYKLLDHLVAV